MKIGGEPEPFRPRVEPGFVRVARGGRPAWVHRCGYIAYFSLIGHDVARPDEIPWHCPQAIPEDGGRPEEWTPLFAYVGERCDQCQGHGWVRITGKVEGALAGYETVTECTACGSSGIPYAIGPADYAAALRTIVLEAEAHSESKTAPEPRFVDGFAMGLRLAAGMFGMPEGADPATRRRYLGQDPPAPTGVRLVLPTGDAVPLSVSRGPDEDGKTAWYAFLPAGGKPTPGCRVAVDYMPAGAVLLVALDPADE